MLTALHDWLEDVEYDDGLSVAQVDGLILGRVEANHAPADYEFAGDGVETSNKRLCLAYQFCDA
jgi:hypothetical protein